MLAKLGTCLLLGAIIFTKAGFGQSVDPVKAAISTSKTATVSATDLTRQITLADSLLFQAFNTCDLSTYQTYFTDDLEFYHDLDGLTVSLAKEMESIKAMCARNKTPIRRS